MPSVSLPSPRPEGLPSYDAYQHAFHQAFQPELYAILDGLPLRPGSVVLDVPCGDGFYAQRLTERAGHVAAVDSSPEYLSLARESLSGRHAEAQQGDAYDLPFPADHFDLVWCAQSLISLDDAEAAVREMVRVLRPGGTLAVLEADEFHHVLLPWPVELEAQVYNALQQAARQRYGGGQRLAPARFVRGLLQNAGLRDIRRATHAADRAVPWGEWEGAFLSLHLDFLAQQALPHLPPTRRVGFEAQVNPESPDGLFRRPDAELTCINVVHQGRKRLRRKG